MPKYRKLHVKTLESFDFNDLPDDFSRLTWLLLPLVSCRDGRGVYHPHWLKSNLYPLREDITTDDVMRAIDSLASRGMVKIYSCAGRDYYQIVNWQKYQGVTTREKESDYPPMGESDATHEQVVTNSRAGHAQYSVFNTQYSDASQNEFPLPVELATPAMLNAWGEWQQHHIDARRPLSRGAATRQIQQFMQNGEAWAIAAIENSIANNYTALVAPRGAVNGAALPPDFEAIWPDILEAARLNHFAMIHNERARAALVAVGWQEFRGMDEAGKRAAFAGALA